MSSHQSASGREYRAVDVHLGHGLRLQVSPGQTDAGNVDSVILHAFSSAQSGPRVINNQPSSYIEHSDASLSKETELKRPPFSRSMRLKSRSINFHSDLLLNMVVTNPVPERGRANECSFCSMIRCCAFQVDLCAKTHPEASP